MSLATLTFLYIYFDFMSGKPQTVSYESAVSVLDRMKDWATWITGLQTAAIAAIGWQAHTEKRNFDLSDQQKWLGFGAISGYACASKHVDIILLALCPTMVAGWRNSSG